MSILRPLQAPLYAQEWPTSLLTARFPVPGTRHFNSKRLPRFLSALVATAVFLAAAVSQIAVAQTATPSAIVLQFNAQAVRAASSALQTQTASFTVTGYSGSFTPTAQMHYGHDYSLGSVTCTAISGGETCTVPVAFAPTLPGGRRDAVFLMNGSTRIGSMLVYGLGNAPFAAVQPGNITSVNSFATSTSFYIYDTVVDENDTVYMCVNTADTIYVRKKDGTVSTISIPGMGDAQALAMDGAGLLYIAGYKTSLITYDTITGAIGSIAVPGYTTGFVEYVTIDGIGNVYTIDLTPSNNATLIKLAPGGAVTRTILNPAVGQAYHLNPDAAGNIFVSGYQINKVNTNGTQSQINTVGASEGVAADASETVYASRYNPSGGVAMLSPVDYTTAADHLDGTTSPLGFGLGSDGLLAVGNYSQLDLVDRTQGSLDLGNTSFAASTDTKFAIYNIGNQPLQFSQLSITGPGYALASASNDCTATTTLAPATECLVEVTGSSSQGGADNASISITTNSLNQTTTQSISIKNNVYAAYITGTPSPLTFASQNTGTQTSQTLTLTNNGSYYSSRWGSAVSSDTAFTLDTSKCAATLAVGSTCALGVTFAPTTAKHYSATITVTYTSSGVQNAPTLTSTFTVTGDATTPAAPAVTLSPTSVAFSNQAVNTTSGAQTVTLTNSGNAALTLSGISITGSGVFAQTNACPASIAAGASCNITVQFTPISVASYTASLVVTDNATGSPQSVTLNGSGTGSAAVTLSPTSIAFGNQTINTTSSAQTVTLTNSGNVALTLSGISITGAGSSAFTQSNACPASLAASASCNITVQFGPTSVASYTASLVIADNASGSPQSVALSGSGTAAPAPVAVYSPTSLSFGSVYLGSASAAQVVLLSNTGNAPLNLTGLPISGSAGFTQTSTCPASLAAGAQCSVSVVFAPQALGALGATLSLASNSSTTAPVVALSGIGAAVPLPVASLTPSGPLSFTSVTGTSSAAQTLTLANSGNTPLAITGITLSGTNASSFTQTTTCSSSLAAGASCAISVVFSAASAGSYTATLNVADNATGSPQTVTLNATATATPSFSIGAGTPSGIAGANQPATCLITITPQNGSFAGTVTFTASGVPANYTASFSPTSLTPGSSAASTTLTITRNLVAGTTFLTAGSVLAFAGLLLIPARRRRRFVSMLLLAIASTAAITLIGCGGGFRLPTTTQSATITVTATGGGLTQTITVPITVQQ